MFPAISRQLWMLARAPATPPASPSLLGRWFRGWWFASLFFVLVEQPYPLRVRFFLSGSRAGMSLLTMRLAHLLQTDQHFFAEPPIDGDQIGNETDEHRLKADDEENRGEDQRLHMPAAITLEEEPQKAGSDRRAGENEQRPEEKERLQRLVDRVDAKDRDDRLPQIGPHAAIQPRGTRRRIGAHRDGLHDQVAVAGVNECFERIRERIEHIDLRCRVAGESAEAARGVAHANA